MGLVNNQSIGGNRRSLNGLSGNVRKLGVKYDVSYQAVLTKASSLGYALPSLARRKKENAALIAMKAAGIWAKIDVFYNFWTDGAPNFSLLNWKDPNNYQASTLNGMGFSVLQGWTGDGISAYISTNFNPSLGSFNYALNNASRFMWVSAPTAPNALDGYDVSQGNSMSMTNSATVQKINQGTNSLDTAFSFSGSGFKIINRLSSTNMSIRNAGANTTRTAASSILENKNQLILRIAGAYGGSTIGSYGMGASLDTEKAILDTILTTLYS